MAVSLATLKTRVKSRLEPESTAPTYNSIHDDQWARWATSLAQKVVAYFYEKDRVQIQALRSLDNSITFILGKSALVLTDFLLVEALKVTSSKTNVTLVNEKEFAWWDSKSFVTTPVSSNPIGHISGNFAYIKPTSITTGYIDYFKKHPDIDSDNGTIFSAIADRMLEDLMFDQVLEATEDVILGAG